ncbi:amidohydrolase [Mollicutes bacterium LVI A0039]|nr:amidohydrolase [Mollicutes bacterium LVI A0039]
MKRIYLGGEIVTLNDNNDIAEAVMIEDAKIVAIGSEEEILKLKDAETEVVDLEGKAMLPGFIDPHSHYGIQSVLSVFKTLAPSPISDVESMDRLIEVMKNDIEEKGYTGTDKFYIASGYDHEQLKEGRHPTRDDLDKVSTEVPLAAVHASLHVGTFNSKALEILGIDEEQPNPPGGHFGRYEGTNKVNGYAEESALQLYIMDKLAPQPADVPAVLKSGQDIYAKAGITTAQDGFTKNEEYQMFNFGANNGIIDLDVHCYPPAVKSLQEGNHWIDGEFGVNIFDRFGTDNNISFSGYKIVLDGSPQARTAWMSKPYEVVSEDDEPDYVAYPFYEDDAIVTEAISYAMERNAPVLVHCNGDASGDQFLRCYKEALAKLDGEYTARSVMIHCQTIREDQIDEMAELNIIPAMFPIHTYFWGDTHIKNFGRERANKISNQKYALSKGLLPTSHEDCPVLPPSTLLSVWAASNRVTRSGEILGEELRLTRYEALRSVTYNAAYQYHEEDIKGTIEVGKMSDLIILDRNVLTCSDDELFNASVVQTIKRGKVIYTK